MPEIPSNNPTPPEDRKPVYSQAPEAMETSEKEKEADLKAVKEDGCGNYPKAEKLLRENEAEFDKMYRQLWGISNYTDDQRRWATVGEMEDKLQ